MTVLGVLRRRWRPTDEYDDNARWLDEQDGGNRWQNYGECLADDVDPDMFYPTRQRVSHVNGEGVHVVDEEPPYPPPEVKAICDRCPVLSVCLARNMDEEFGIFAGMTGYQRGLLNKKIKRKHCPGCGSTDVVIARGGHQEACLACSLSWDVI